MVAAAVAALAVRTLPFTYRTHDGASDFCVMRGYISTLRKQKIHVLSALEQVFRGKPVYPCTETA